MAHVACDTTPEYKIRMHSDAKSLAELNIEAR